MSSVSDFTFDYVDAVSDHEDPMSNKNISIQTYRPDLKDRVLRIGFHDVLSIGMGSGRCLQASK